MSSQGDIEPVTLTTHDGMNIEQRQLLVNAPAPVVFKTYAGLGGQRGWPNFNWAWNLRGFMDRLVGGVGMRRGRRDPDELRVGDALDFWRVEVVEPDRLLRLRAEMKVPGRAWLQFESIPQPDNKTLLKQTALFAPKGLSGFLYWYGIYPIHGFIFSGMVQRLAWRAEAVYHGVWPLEAKRTFRCERWRLAGGLTLAAGLLLAAAVIWRRLPGREA